MAQSLAMQVYETIKNEIITCVLQPGQQIAQPQLAERYQTGITPIREALQKLTKEGLVQSIPRFGYIVSPITIEDVGEIYELRSVLESAAARLAAMRATQEQINNLIELANYTYVFQDHDSYTDFLSHNREFHQAVAVASGNKRLAESISQLLDELTRVFHLGLDIKDSAEEMRNEHKHLVDALQKQDPDESEQIVQAQIVHSQQRVIEALLPSARRGASDLLGQNIQINRISSHK